MNIIIGECRNKYKAVTGDGCTECIKQKIVFSLYRNKERPVIIRGLLFGVGHGFIHCRVMRFGKKYARGIELRFQQRDIRFIKAPSFCEKGWEKCYKNSFSKRWQLGADGRSQPATIPNRIRSGPSWINPWRER